MRVTLPIAGVNDIKKPANWATSNNFTKGKSLMRPPKIAFALETFFSGTTNFALIVLTIIPSHSPICVGSQWDLTSLAFQLAYIKSFLTNLLALIALSFKLLPAVPSSMYMIDAIPFSLHLATKGLNIFVNK